MKLFISYRRGDSGGRAGRLFDALAARFGPDDVFHDVAGVAPGVDFTARIDDAIARSDAVLVVIGPHWLGTEPVGQRRIDESDDFVRQEVRRALASDIRVVPVLVDEAVLPTAGELPDDLATLAFRQSVGLSDDTWHQDIDALVRRLEGDHHVITGRRWWRSWPLAVAAGALVAGLVVTVAVLRPDSGGSSDDSSLRGCPPDESWTSVDVVDIDSPPVVEDPGEFAEIEVQEARVRSDGDDGGAVELVVAATNVTDPAIDDDGSLYFYEEWVSGLLVDDVFQSEIACWGPARGEESLRFGQTVIVTMGFETPLDPTDAVIGLEMTDRTVIPVTS